MIKLNVGWKGLEGGVLLVGLDQYSRVTGRGLLCEKVPRKAISWHPLGNRFSVVQFIEP